MQVKSSLLLALFIGCGRGHQLQDPDVRRSPGQTRRGSKTQFLPLFVGTPLPAVMV